MGTKASKYKLGVGEREKFGKHRRPCVPGDLHKGTLRALGKKTALARGPHTPFPGDMAIK